MDILSNLNLIHSGKTDPYVVLSIGDQIIRSKKNSQTTVIGPPGEPIWNQVNILTCCIFHGSEVILAVHSMLTNYIFFVIVSRISICLFQILENRNC